MEDVWAEDNLCEKFLKELSPYNSFIFYINMSAVLGLWNKYGIILSLNAWLY